jgi:predicted nucleic acid-binding protein
MAIETWIIDSSAFHKLASSEDLDLWETRIERGLVHVASLTKLEIGFSVRSREHYDAVFEAAVMQNLIEVSLSDEAEKTALNVQKQLVAQGNHRGVSLPDLLVAVLGHSKGHTVLHHDKDFELIGSVTGQKTERLRVKS